MNRILSQAVLVVAVSLGSAGCANERDHQLEVEAERNKAHIDMLWHQGYGFNNPNPDRIKKGLPPLNFDGTEDREEPFFSWLFRSLLGL